MRFFTFPSIFLIFAGTIAFSDIIKLPDSSVYNGAVVGGFFNGKGVQVWKNGDKYDGEYKDGLMSGYGIYSNKIMTYKGEFGNGLYNGKGVIEFKSGGSFEGQFLDGYYNGEGRLVFSNWDMYIGQFKNGMMNGNGWMKYSNGESLKAVFVDDNADGKVIYTYNDGSYYQGGFKHGAFDGDGCIFSADGKTKTKVKYENGLLVEMQEEKIQINLFLVLFIASFIFNVLQLVIYIRNMKRKN